MKTFTPPSGFLAIVIFVVSCFISMPMQAQTIQIDSTFTTDGEIFPFSPNDTIYGLSISGHGTLYSDTSLVRVILTDNSGNEWMVYEAYPFINPNWNIELNEIADETKYRQVINPNSLKIQIINASINIDYLTYLSDYHENLSGIQASYKDFIETAKVDSINETIESNLMLWFANRTPISDLDYISKKSSFGEKYNLMGLDYYTGGIYDPRPGVTGTTDGSELIDSWDWRTRHGANDPAKSIFYYDENSNGNGWITSIKNQTGWNCDGLCYIYGPLAAIEGVANLYFNDHKNFDLSEQHVLECDNENYEECTGGQPWRTNKYVKDFGVVDEICYPRAHSVGDCNEDLLLTPCPTYRIKIADTINVNKSNSDSIKKALINHGPLELVLQDYPSAGKEHSLALIGYGKLKIGDIFHDPANPINDITVDSTSIYLGHLYWIFKNSMGTDQGDQGYFYHLAEDVTIDEPVAYKLPVENIILPNDDTIAWYDKDKDGYWNWGISESYNLSPSSCSLLRDSDDSESRIGPFDSNFSSIPVMPAISVSLGILNGIQITDSGFVSLEGSNTNDITYTFEIKNPGTAQLNLERVGIGENGKVTIEYQNYSHPDKFVLVDLPDRNVCMNNDTTTFKIKLIRGALPGTLAHVHISLDEPDMDPTFEFTLVFNGCQTAIGYDSITTVTAWNQPYRSQIKDLYIKRGGELTVSGTVYLSSEADIFVERGAKLIVDGGRLTGSCGNLWNGVDVWGNTAYPQTVEYQGTVEVKNEGTIEFADTAIATVRINGIYTINSGGIVKCTDAHLKDNYVGVYLSPYYSPLGGRNLSHFKRSEFFITDQYYNRANLIRTSPKCGLQMAGVVGIDLEGCSFSNNSLEEKRKRGSGILNLDADFHVKNACITDDQINCEPIVPCTFEGLEYGIKSSNIWSNCRMSVESADFIDNYRGIYMSLNSDASLDRNNFKYNTDDNYFKPGDTLVGIYAERCSRYQIEENKFNGVDPDNYKLVGMHILNSGVDYNEIYNNFFDNVNYGIIAAGENRNKDGTAGLCIKCNHFTDCITDVFVTPDGGSIQDLLGIASAQGIKGSEAPSGVDPKTVGAGNTFTLAGNVTPESNFYNDDKLDLINYTFQYSEFYKLDPNPSNNINRIVDNDIEYFPDTSCPNHFQTSGLQLALEKDNLSNETEILEAYTDTLGIYIDGGDTPGLNFVIETSFPEDALDLRQQLLYDSPYLSDTVMKSVIEKENVFLNAMVRDILVANPQSAKSTTILAALDDKADPMPEYLWDDIMEGKNILGNKEAMERKMAAHYELKTISLSNILRFYKSDTLLGSSRDTVMAYLENNDSPETHYQLAFCKLNNGDSTETMYFLQSIPFKFPLASNQIIIQEFYEDLFNILIPMQSDSIKIDSTNYPGLFSLMDETNELPGIYSRNLLTFNNMISYLEPVYLPQILKNSPDNRKLHHGNATNDSYLKVYPNPSKSFLILEYNIEDPSGMTSISISDVYGKKFDEIPLQQRQNQILLDTRSLSPGVYIICLVGVNKNITCSKVLIIR